MFRFSSILRVFQDKGSKVYEITSHLDKDNKKLNSRSTQMVKVDNITKYPKMKVTDKIKQSRNHKFSALVTIKFLLACLLCY